MPVLASLVLADDEITLFSSSLYEGNQGYQGPLGRVIEVKLPIKVTEVGAFESNPEGPFVIKVGIYDNLTKELVAGSRVYEVNRKNSRLEKKFRFLTIEPVSLKPGSYMLVAQGYFYGQQNGNTGLGGPGTGVHGEDCISAEGSAFGGGDISYPTNPDGNIYHAANIKFSRINNKEGNSDRSGSNLIRRRN